MAHFITVEPKTSVIRVAVYDEMGMKDYEHIVPFIDSAIEEYDAARLFFDLTEYEGREAGAVFEDIELKLPNFADVERVAFIGHPIYKPRLPEFCKPFTSAKIKYFYSGQGKAAEEWIHED